MRLILFLCLAVGASAETNRQFSTELAVQGAVTFGYAVCKAGLSVDDARFAALAIMDGDTNSVRILESAPAIANGNLMLVKDTNSIIKTGHRPIVEYSNGFWFVSFQLSNRTNSTPIRWLESPVTVPILNYKKNQGWETPSPMRWSPTEDVILGLREDGVVVWRERVQTNYAITTLPVGITNH